jgi:hypothetical protein
MSETKERREAYCSWCKKHYEEAGVLVEGPDRVYICEQCLILCAEVFEKERAKRGHPPLDVSKVIADWGRARTNLPPLID